MRNGRIGMRGDRCLELKIQICRSAALRVRPASQRWNALTRKDSGRAKVNKLLQCHHRKIPLDRHSYRDSLT
jgi:hypothetical protein